MKKITHEKNNWLVVSTHLKNISQMGNLPQIGVKIKNNWNQHLVYLILFRIFRKKNQVPQKREHGIGWFWFTQKTDQSWETQCWEKQSFPSWPRRSINSSKRLPHAKGWKQVHGEAPRKGCFFFRILGMPYHKETVYVEGIYIYI